MLHRFKKERRETLLNVTEFLAAHRVNLTDAHRNCADLEFLVILIEDFLRRSFRKMRPSREHVARKLVRIYSGNSRKYLGSLAVGLCTSRRMERKRIGKNRRAHQAGNLLRDLDIPLTRRLVNNRCGAAERNVSEVDRLERRNAADPVVVDNLKDFGLLHAVNRLCGLIMVHKDNLLPAHIHQITAGHGSAEYAFMVENRKIAIPAFRHNVPDAVDIIVGAKCYKVLRRHEVPDRHGKVNQSRHGKCIMRRLNNNAVLLFRKPLNRHRNLRALTYNQTGGSHLNCAKLRFITVSENYEIARADIILHQIRIGCGNQYLAFRVAPVGIACHGNSFKCIEYICIRCLCSRQNT